jgi:hypothetical protein
MSDRPGGRMSRDCRARVAFWTEYQPGLRLALRAIRDAEVRTDRYGLEPDILEMRRFWASADKDVSRSAAASGRMWWSS